MIDDHTEHTRSARAVLSALDGARSWLEAHPGVTVLSVTADARRGCSVHVSLADLLRHGAPTSRTEWRPVAEWMRPIAEERVVELALDGVRLVAVQYATVDDLEAAVSTVDDLRAGL